MTMSTLSSPTAELLCSRGRVATMGMFIIDQFQVKDDDGQPVVLEDEAIGGGGIFAMTAARQFLPPTHCSLVVDVGEDFPQRFREHLESFGEEMTWFRHREGKTTRALNIYSGARIGQGHQSFRYLSPQLQITPKDLVLPPSPFGQPIPPEWIHVVCGTERAVAIAQEIEALRERGIQWNPKLLWEPLGHSCTADGLQAILDVVHLYAAFSPNLLEMQTILSLAPVESEAATVEAAHGFEKVFKEAHPNNATAIIVRAGPLGAYILSQQWSGWVPAFWREDEQDKVVDVTGGGNAWMGGLCAGLLLSNGDFRTASIYASTAASFTIQQRGLPHLDSSTGTELWNGDNVWTRLQEMARRVPTHNTQTTNPTPVSREILHRGETEMTTRSLGFQRAKRSEDKEGY